MEVGEAVEAIKKRVSCRAFDTERAVEAEKLEALQALAGKADEESGLALQLVDGAETKPLVLGPSMFKNAPRHYLAVVGPDSPRGQELAGYYGEELVLLATSLGLGTCWVAGTYDEDSVTCAIGLGSKLHAVIPIGYAPRITPLKQARTRKALRKQGQDLGDLFEGPLPLVRSPLWIQAGVGAVWAGPSAINEQAIVIRQAIKDAPVSPFIVPERAKTGLAAIDLGIAKLHFELAAASQGMKGAWQWGDGGSLIPE